MNQPITIELDLNEEQLETLQKVQKQYGLQSIEDTAKMLFSKRFEDIRQYATGDIGQPSWLSK